jgi:hypothetical protein
MAVYDLVESGVLSHDFASIGNPSGPDWKEVLEDDSRIITGLFDRWPPERKEVFVSMLRTLADELAHRRPALVTEDLADDLTGEGLFS